MRILFFIHSLASGGAERVTATLANHWAGKGREVLVVSVDSIDRDFYTLDKGVRRVSLGLARPSRNPVDGCVNNLRRVWALRSILHRERPDIAVAMMSTANSTLALAGRLSGVTTIGSERLHPPAAPLGRVWELVRRRTYPLLSGLVAQTGGSAAWLRDHTGTRNIAVIPNPVDFPLRTHEPLVSPSEALASVRGARVLLAVGRLEEQKGFDRLISAFGVLSKRHPDWVLVVLGRGGLDGVLSEQAAALGLSERVLLLGAVGNVAEWYETADVYALTSRFEGFPNTLLEAMAYGVPAVAVDCETGPREIIRHEVDGLLVPQADHEALESALGRMMEDAALRSRFRERAVEVRDRFSVKRIAAQWERLFQRV